MVEPARPHETGIKTIILLLILGGGFVLRLTCLTTYKTLPGWDPSSHIAKALTTVSTGHLTTSLFWYPPGYHFLLATMILFVGLTTVTPAFLLLVKLVVALLSALQVVVVFLVARRVFESTTVGLLAALFMSVSLRHLEMLGWGGYPNILGMLFMGLALNLLSHDYDQNTETTIAVLAMILGVVLSHSISTLVLVAVIMSYLLSFSIVSGRPPKRELLVATLSVILVFGFYLIFASEHILFILNLIAGYSPHISTTNPYVETFGEIPTYLTPLGVLSTLLYAAESKEKRREATLLLSWLIVPLLLFQTNFIARFANRFSYFIVPPMALLPAFGLKYTAEKAHMKIWKDGGTILSNRVGRIIPLGLCLILSTAGTIYLVSDIPSRTLHYASYYLVCAPRDYDASIFARTQTAPTVNVLAAYPADPWISILTERDTSSADVETVNFSMENSVVQIEETGPYNVGRNPSVHLDIEGESYEALRLKDGDLKIDFETQDSEYSTDLSESQYQRVEWHTRSTDTITLKYVFGHRFFTLEKKVTIRSGSPLVELRYKITPKITLSKVSVTCSMVLNRELKYYSLFIPGFLNWLNPWDNPTVRDNKGRFAYVSFPLNEISDRFFALLDEDKAALLAIMIGDEPQELTIGARPDKRIDNVKTTYTYGRINRGEEEDFSFEILLTHLPRHTTFDEMDREFLISLIQRDATMLLNSQDYLEVAESTPATHIQGRRDRLPTGYLSDPHFNRIYDNGLSNLYALNRTQQN